MMSNIKKFGTYLAVVSCLTTASLIPLDNVQAYSNKDGSIENVNGFDVYDPLSWNQYDSADMPESWLKDKMLDGSSGVPFPEGGDSIFVYTFLALKTGFKQPGYTPANANADLEYIHAYANGIPHFGAEGIFPEDWKTDLDESGSQYQTGKSLEDVKKLWFEGKLVVLQMKNDDYELNGGSLFIAIDSIDQQINKVYIFDSTKPSLVFSDVYRNEDILSVITISSKKNKSYKLPVLNQKRGSLNLFSKDGDRDPSTLGGGGGYITKEMESSIRKAERKKKKLELELQQASSSEKLKNQHEEEHKETETKNHNYLYFLFPISILLGGGFAFWLKRRIKRY